MTDCLTTGELAELKPGMPLPERHFAHLTGCASCRKAVDAALRETEASGEAPADSPFDATLDAVPLEEPGRYRRVLADGQAVLLGAGGYARVELARDEVVGRDVALKTLRSGHLQSARRAVAEKRLLQEARVVGQLEHPSIVPLYDLARTDDGQLFYAMRRIRGRTLADAIRAAGSLDERLRLLPHVLAACNAVAYAHSRGVLHRDLKPQNVMIDRFGETLVIDWGLASTRGDDAHDDGDLESSGVIRLVPGDQTVSDGRGRLGTPAYMSPEQLTGLRALVDARSDVFGLGGILYEVLTGQAPREQGPLQAPPKKVLEVAPTVPRDLAALCDKALEGSREARYQTAEELARDLDAWLHGLRVTAHAYRPLELARRFVRQHRYAVLVGLGAFFALVAMFIVSAVRVRDERNQARSFALLLAGDTLDKLPFDERDPFRADLTARVSSYLAATDEADDPAQAATAWARLASEYASISRNKEALRAAQRCLTLLPERPSDERTEATRLMCEVTVVEESGRTLPERLTALEALWQARRVQPTEPALLNAQVALLLSLGHLASNTGDEAASARWSNQAFEIARHIAVLEPSSAASWAQLGTAHYVRAIDALNAEQGEEALTEARAAVECARRAHQLQHSPHSLLRLADMLSDAHFAQGLHPQYVRPGEHEATAREATALFEALLALDDAAPVPRRRFSEFLVQRGDLTRAWQLVAPVPITDFFHQRPKLYLALLVGETDLVLTEQAREPAESRSIDSAILTALAHAVKGDHRSAAAAARQGTKESFASHWPVDAMEPWSARQRGPAAPALVRVARELTAAQRANDEPRAHQALEAFAAELDALAP